jgi:protein-S-isoprenylcysteine O-methyltransferase Ste14
MIRTPYRRWLERCVRTDYHGAVYSILSGVFLLILVLFWQRSAITLMTAKGMFRWLCRAVFFLSCVGFYLGIRALGSFDALGTHPILHSLRGTQPDPPIPFTVRGPYRWVRHPLYSFCLVMIWSCPDLTADRLLFNLLFTAWIIIGSILEERDLVTAFGRDYLDYQVKVPMLIPRTIRPIL